MLHLLGAPHNPAGLQLDITNARMQLLMARSIQLLLALLLPAAFFVLTGGTGTSMLGMSAAAALRSSSSIRPPRLSPRALSPSCSSTNATGSIARAAGHGRGQHTNSNERESVHNTEVNSSIAHAARHARRQQSLHSPVYRRGTAHRQLGRAEYRQRLLGASLSDGWGVSSVRPL